MTDKILIATVFLFAGIRVGLGFEWADFIFNDPSLALTVRY